MEFYFHLLTATECLIFTKVEKGGTENEKWTSN